MRAILALLLLISGATQADQVDIYDFVTGYRSFFSDCTVGTGVEFEATCAAVLISDNDRKPPQAPEVWPEFSPEVILTNSFTQHWISCRLTKAEGLPGGGVYFRLDCLGEPLVFLSGFEAMPVS